MKIVSPAFKDGEKIPEKYTCDCKDINPPLEILDVPDNTKSLVLIADDPDAPMGTWVHWTIWNISPETGKIPENSCPDEAIEGTTSFGSTGYGGPCPPSGTHRYYFKLYAIDSLLELESSSRVKDIEEAMDGHILDQAKVMGLYKRK